MIKPWLKKGLSAEQRAASFFPEIGMLGDVGDLALAFQQHASECGAAVDLHRAVMVIDYSLDALDAAARREARREAGKKLRCITEAKRASNARKFVADMRKKYNIGTD